MDYLYYCMNNKIRCAIVGIGGHGETHLQYIGKAEDAGLCTLNAAVVRPADNLDHIIKQWRLIERGVVIFNSFNDLILEGSDLFDLVILPVGIGFHAEYSCKAMRAGKHVLCEKPPAATIQEVDSMSQWSEASGKVCAIGFPQMSSDLIIEAKLKVCEGIIGEVKKISNFGIWKRDKQYFSRNGWAGKITSQGRWILDGTINNPFAHQIMASLFLASAEQGRSARPREVTAELYHGNDIESEDTSCIRIKTDSGATIFGAATQCGPKDHYPEIEIVGTKGTIGIVIGKYAKIRVNNSVETIHARNDERTNMYANIFNAINGVHPIQCPVSITKNFTLTVNGAFESSAFVNNIPAEYRAMHSPYGSAVPEEAFTAVHDIESIISRAFKERLLFSEAGVAWARPSQKFMINDDYSFFRFHAHDKATVRKKQYKGVVYA